MGPLDLPPLDVLERARQGLAGVLVPTPLVPLAGHDSGIWLKPEIHQRIGSFKLRGVHHAVSALTPEQRQRGLLTVSAGNTAQALAWSGRHFGVRAESVMPEGAPRAKIEAVRALGGTPRLVPTDEVFRFLRERLWEQEPAAFVHPWTEPLVWTGHASLGLELLDERPDLGSVYVPVGGGGLFVGVGAALRARGSRARLVAVEPEGCPALRAALDAGHPLEVPCDTICDGVAVPYVTDELFPRLAALADDCRLVSEREVRAAMVRLLLENRMLAEGSGALALAAALADAAAGRLKTPAVVLVTGGSLDVEKLRGLLAQAPGVTPLE